MAIYTCDYCHERKEIVQFIDDGLVPGVVNMQKKRPACRECLNNPAIDGKPSEKQPMPWCIECGAASMEECNCKSQPETNDVGDDEYPF